MKRLLFALLLCATAHAADDVRVFWWQESGDEKTGEKQFAFFVAPQPVKEMFEAVARHDAKASEELAAKLPKHAWHYALLLTGEQKTYPKEKITLIVPGPCTDLIKISSGTVAVDRKKNTVSIALKVEEEGRVVAFKGNGEYSIEKKVPEPTPTPGAPPPKQPSRPP